MERFPVPATCGAPRGPRRLPALGLLAAACVAGCPANTPTPAAPRPESSVFVRTLPPGEGDPFPLLGVDGGHIAAAGDGRPADSTGQFPRVTDDADGDGLADAIDRCPADAEVRNGIDDQDGCPDEVPAIVEPQRIPLEDMVHFEFGTAVLRAGSLEVLEGLAQLLQAHPEYAKVEIRGYADPQGDAEPNLRLSQRRAERIRDALIRFGVASERLAAVGFGESDPIAPGQRISDNRQNRRVEFVIVEVQR